ncbi:hypothetical protein Brms1b_009416 [Colletotrichum noveboracense]|nr:hypothetical protein CBS470a_006607 [Colletotrichum nupharicola]KAJ0308597.1 hypothetical protein Brms1b_009416 [Colletotrichum noveboracense]
MIGSWMERPKLVIEYGTGRLDSSLAGWYSRAFLKLRGDGASMLVHDGGSSSFQDQQKSDSSVEILSISSCSRVKALEPSPYSSGMLMSKIPSMQYAISSTREVLRHDSHDILSATLAPEIGAMRFRL